MNNKFIHKNINNKCFWAFNKKPNTNWITVLTVISCLSVVFLHVNTGFWNRKTSDPLWISTIIQQCILYFGVPCFFMISGATLLDYNKRYNTKTYFWKRTKKVIIPYFIWSGIALGIAFGTHTLTPKNFSFEYLWNQLFCNAGINENYWFFIPLILLYFVIPVIAFIDAKHKDMVCFWIVVFGVGGTFIIPWLLSIFNPDCKWAFSLGLFYPVVYACLGYLIKKYDFGKVLKILIYCVGILALIGLMVGVYFYSLKVGKPTYQPIMSYSGILVFLYSLCIIVFFKPFGNSIMTKKKAHKTFQFLSGFTFSIYLTHKWIRRMLYFGLYKGVGHIKDISFIYRFTAPFFICLIIIVAVWLIRKIPYVNKVFAFILP